MANSETANSRHSNTNVNGQQRIAQQVVVVFGASRGIGQRGAEKSELHPRVPHKTAADGSRVPSVFISFSLSARMADTAVWWFSGQETRRAMTIASVPWRCDECVPSMQCVCERRHWSIHALADLVAGSTTVAQTRYPSVAAAAAAMERHFVENPCDLFAIRTARGAPSGEWGNIEFARWHFAPSRPRLGAYEWTFVTTNADAAAFVKEFTRHQ